MDPWLNFWSGYVGSIVGALVAGGLAWYLSTSESKNQKIRFEEELKIQKKTDIEVQSSFLKKQLSIEKKSIVVAKIFSLIGDIANLHNHILSNKETDTEIINKKLFDLHQKVSQSFIEVTAIAAFVPLFKTDIEVLFYRFLVYGKKLTRLSNLHSVKYKYTKEALNTMDFEKIKTDIEKLKDKALLYNNQNEYGQLTTDLNRIETLSVLVKEIEIEQHTLNEDIGLFYKTINTSLYEDVENL